MLFELHLSVGPLVLEVVRIGPVTAFLPVEFLVDLPKCPFNFLVVPAVAALLCLVDFGDLRQRIVPREVLVFLQRILSAPVALVRVGLVWQFRLGRSGGSCKGGVAAQAKQ